MKKGIIVLSVLFIVIACNQNVDRENAAQQEVAGNLLGNEAKKVDYSEVGFKLMETETLGDLKLGLTVEQVEKIIGKPEEVTPFEVWGADGFEHQARIYRDSTIDIDFVRTRNGTIVSNMITIMGDCDFKTSRDIGIGSSGKKVKEVYLQETSHADNHSVIVGTIYGGIIFQLKEDKVSNIFIGAAAE